MRDNLAADPSSTSIERTSRPTAFSTPHRRRSLARGHTELCIKVLAGIVSQETVPPAARASAAIHLLDRGWGKPPQALTGADGEGDIRVLIRHIVQDRDVALDAKIIDATPVRHEGGDEG